MKVFVITQDFKNAYGKGASPIAVVLDKAGIEKPYNAEEFTVVRSETQMPALVAFNEISKMSSAAQQELGFGAEELAILERDAAGGGLVKEGKTLYVDVYRGIDGMDFPTVRGVYTYNPKKDAYTSYEQFTVAQTLKDHFAQEDRKSAKDEIFALSDVTKNYLTQRKMKPI
ncbi:MAG: hypothetical protein ACAH83_00315 [Alphaproteobacteria bacterium]